MANSVFSSITDHLEWRLLQLRYRLNSGTVKRSVGEIESSFNVDSFREFLRVTDYQDEDFVIECLLERVRPDDVFWDIGANIGTYSCYVGQKVERTIAVEPFPDNARRAQKNCQLNGIDATIVKYALGEHREKASLAPPESDQSVAGVGTFSLQNTSTSSESIDVNVVPGDELAREESLPLPDVMKIDVEGGELDVLEGFDNGLRNARIVLVEVHPSHVEQSEVTDVLESGGLSVEVLRQRNDEVHLLATRTDE
ncbi:FkbM family methyltransferase [Halolamina sp. CBA1230]|nr:FkbM family methyltransferase [Halolamina sp. CBA1230]